MHPNWKLGLTRLFIVVWALWLAVVLLFVFSFHRFMSVGNIFEAVALWGLLIPGLLLLALRWVCSGFARSNSS